MADYVKRYKFETNPQKIVDDPKSTGIDRVLALPAAALGAVGNLGLKAISDGYGYSQTPEQTQRSFEKRVATDMTANLTPAVITNDPGKRKPFASAVGGIDRVAAPSGEAAPVMTVKNGKAVPGINSGVNTTAAPPLLASHTPGADLGIGQPAEAATIDQVLSDANGRAEKMKKPLLATSTTVPSIDQTAQPGGGIMTVAGGGSASIDAEGNINRSRDWRQGIGGGVTVVPADMEMTPASAPNAAPAVPGSATETGRDISAITAGTDFAARTKAPRDAVETRLGFLPDDYYQNPAKYQNVLTGIAADLTGQARLLDAQNTGEYQKGMLAIDKPYKEGVVANQRYVAEESAQARVEAAKETAAGRVEAARTKKGEEGAKDYKELTKTFYDSIKGLNLPKGFEGRHMELAKDLALAQDPESDFGIYFAPGQERQGIATKRSVYDPLLSKYLGAGYPAADAHALAYADLQALEQAQGVKLSKPFPNLDRLPKNDRKPVDNLGAA